LGSLELLCLTSTANTSSESAEWNTFIMFDDVAEVGVSLGELETYALLHEYTLSNQTQETRTLNGSRNFTHVLEVGAKVLAPGASG
jgi:hypothetical protein